MEFQLLKDIVIIWGLAIVVLYFFNRLKIPSIIGLLLTGMIAGPSGLRMISGAHEVEILAEIGVVLLLFTIGIEFSFKNLVKIRKTLLVGGSFQVFATILAITLVARAAGNSWNEALFIGFLIALSSTAIVLKLLQDNGEIDTAHGRTSLGILIFQDIIIIPMILLTPLLAGKGFSPDGSLLVISLKLAGFVVGIWLGSKYALPWVLLQIARTQSRELFLLAILVIAFAVAFFTHNLGLSLALGAFIAGLIVSESEYSQQALANIIPFLYVFTSFFFLSIGMLINLEYVMSNPMQVLLFTLIVLSIKTVLAILAAFILGYPLRTCIIAGFTISQVGEFSFILSGIGISEGILSDANYQLFLSVSILGMAATPLVIWLSRHIADLINKWSIPEFMRTGFAHIPESTIARLEDHLVIVGYGINGRNVASAAESSGIPYFIVEINPDTVIKERAKGRMILYGDASHEEVMDHVNIQEARVLVVTIPSPGESMRIVRLARQMNQTLDIIIRARFVADVEKFFDAGANEVIPEEFETSVEIFTRVLSRYEVPRNRIDEVVSGIRSHGYEMFRKLAVDDSTQHEPVKGDGNGD